MENKIIVAFHVGRGGRFNNGGHVTFIGEKNLQKLIQLNFDHLFEQNRVNGKFSKPYLTDLNGTIIVDSDEYNNEVGFLEFDTIYDSDYCKYIEDCSDEELRLISDSSEYKSFELEEYLKDVCLI
jgi:hypothetical protein